MRTKKALMNSVSSIIGEVVTLICGLILPRLILSTFGSTYNGITSSISQFLSCVILLRAGVGAVTRAALYKPLADGDLDKISGIYNATAAFMRKVALIFAAFLFLFACIYPLTVRKDFDWLFSASLVVIIGSSTFMDNYFGIANHMLLMADQRNYVNTIFQVVQTVLNTCVAAVLILAGASIHLVKLGSAVVYFIRPIALYFYVQKKYRINRSIKADSIALGQRWDAFAIQVAAFINNNTDIMVLTVFAGLKEVSVYTIYYLVTSSLYKVEQTLSESVSAAFGNMMAKNEKAVFQKNFRLFEFAEYYLSSFLFICGGLLIVPFATVYTRNITDVSYYRPLFGTLMCINQFIFCARLPYDIIIEAAGHFKQMRNTAILEAAMNIVISVTLVINFGLIGVTIGTFCALSFRFIRYSLYASEEILHRRYFEVIKRMCVCASEAVLVVLILDLFHFSNCANYFVWFVQACITGVVTIIVITAGAILFYHDELIGIISKIKSVAQKKKVKCTR